MKCDICWSRNSPFYLWKPRERALVYLCWDCLTALPFPQIELFSESETTRELTSS